MEIVIYDFKMDGVFMSEVRCLDVAGPSFQKCFLDLHRLGTPNSQVRKEVLTKSSSCPESSGSYHQQDQDGRLLLILTN